MQLENQRYGRNKDTLVNRTLIDSGDYRKKFDKITDNPNINRVIYSKAKEMLKHRSGTMIEDMYWINGNTGEIVTSIVNQTAEEKIDYTESVLKAIDGVDNLIALHTHPASLPPSIADFNSAAIHGYTISLVICHDGTIYQYASDEIISEKLYDLYVAKFMQEGYSEKAAQLKTLETLKINHSVDLWEVK